MNSFTLIIKLDGSQVLVAVADRVFIYDAHSGEMIKQTRGNKYSIDISII